MKLKTYGSRRDAKYKTMFSLVAAGREHTLRAQTPEEKSTWCAHLSRVLKELDRAAKGKSKGAVPEPEVEASEPQVSEQSGAGMVVAGGAASSNVGNEATASGDSATGRGGASC